MNFNIQKLTALTQKYLQNVPRYTSYPTVLELTPPNDIQTIKNALLQNLAPLSLYVHIPYCKTICNFCACNRVLTSHKNEKLEYLASLKHEIELINTITQPQISSIHIGGGSPSFLEPTELEILLKTIQDSTSFTLSPNSEKSVEVDPRTLNPEKATIFKDYGFSRFSLGIQDFDPDVQTAISRIQSYDLIETTLQYLKDLGLNNFNFDLVYGLPKQTIASFTKTLTQTISLLPNRIALYSFAYVPWKAKNQSLINEADLPNATDKLKLFLLAIEMLQQAGYVYIGLDHFALPNDPLVEATKNNTLTRNFMGYTTDRTAGVLALGASGISDISGLLYQNQTDILAYKNALQENTLPIAKCYQRNTEDKIRAKIIEKIMTASAINKNEFLADFNSKDLTLAEAIYAETLQNLEKFVEDELVKIENENIQITAEGKFFIRTLASTVDAKLKKYKEKRKQTFSKGM